MAVFQLGVVIRSRREELGLSQEDLADGICSVPTLSRIENGTRLPTKDHFEMLLQRLGYSAMSMDFFTNNQDFTIHKIKSDIRQAYIAKDTALAARLLEKLKKVLDCPSENSQQFVQLYDTLLNAAKYTNEEKLERFESALQLTCPKYKDGRIPRVLSYEEIILLNNIAIRYNAMGDRARAIEILYEVKEYYDHRIASAEEAWRTQTMILYNLSKYLGMEARYDECIAICDLGIRIARTTGRCTSLGKTLFNRGWALYKRNYPSDRENAKYSMRQAYDFCMVMAKTKEADEILKSYEDCFNEPMKEKLE